MRPGAAGPVTSDAPGCCDVTILPLTKKLPSSSRVSGPPSVPATALQERHASSKARLAFMAKRSFPYSEQFTSITPPGPHGVEVLEPGLRVRLGRRGQAPRDCLSTDDRAAA